MNSFTIQLRLFFNPKFLLSTLALAGGASVLILLFGAHQVSIIQAQQTSMQPHELIIREMIAIIYPLLAIFVFAVVVDLMWRYLGYKLREHDIV